MLSRRGPRSIVRSFRVTAVQSAIATSKSARWTLDVDVDGVAFLFHPLATYRGLNLAHQLAKDPHRFGGLPACDAHRQHAARLGAHRRFPQLFRIHLTQPL